jgi:CYTH domain-containing protein
MIEIERKFLIKGDFYPFATKKVRIIQGYLCASTGLTVRVRIMDKTAFITIKGPSERNGFSRAEFEYEIPCTDAVEIMKLCRSTIEKERHYVPNGKHTFEVDIFHGAHEGLIIAEIELSSEDELFNRPDWLGEEVTGDIRYYNSYLSTHPFNSSNRS